MENAYFDGVEYVCPDCGHTWGCDEVDDEYSRYQPDEDDDDDFDYEVIVH